jgi:hypothetical protein
MRKGEDPNLEQQIMDPLKAKEEIEQIAARLRSLGCSPAQVQKHILPLKRQYGLVKPSPQRIHFAVEPQVGRNGRFQFNPQFVHQEFGKIKPDSPQDQLAGTDTMKPPWD